MPGQKKDRGDEGAPHRQHALDKTETEEQLSQVFKLMPMDLEARHECQSRAHHHQQHQSSMHAAAQYDTLDHRESAILPSCCQEQYNFSGYHGEQSTIGRTVTQQQTYQDLQRWLRTPPPSVDGMEGSSSSAHAANAPRKSYGPSTFDFEAKIRLVASNPITNSRYQSIMPSGGIQQWNPSSAFQTAATYPSMFYSQNSMVPQSRSNDSQVRDNCQIGGDQEAFINESYYQQQLQPWQAVPLIWNSKPVPAVQVGSYQIGGEETNFMDENYCQQQLEPSRDLPLMWNSKVVPRTEMAKFREVCGCLLHSASKTSVNSSTCRDIGNTFDRDNNGSGITRLANLILTSEPLLTTSSSNLGPIQPPHHVKDLKSASDTTSDKSLSKETYSPSKTRWTVNRGTSPENERTLEVGPYKERVHRVTNSLAAIIPESIQRVANSIQAEVDHILESNEPGFLQHFRPSNSALKNVGLLIDDRPHISPDKYGCSNNYQGDVTIAHNLSADIPDNENCAVWILGLPPHVSHTELLGSIQNIGQIYASVINPPIGQHHTSAAKIVFFERSQAESFMALVLNGRFLVMGRQIRHIRWNKIKSTRYPYSENSRVIRVTGPRHLMDFGFFEIFFLQRFTYELEARQEIQHSAPDMVMHEWRFGSLRSQAASAKTAIERELKGIFTVEWARDPCM